MDATWLIQGAGPLIAGWCADLLFADPTALPHPVVWMGSAIARCERRFNRGAHRLAAGALTASLLVALTFLIGWGLLRLLEPWPWVKCAVEAILIFFCLAGTTLVREVRAVFAAADRSLEAGRRQVGRIVGRDTAALTPQEVRAAALETLAENLSDGVVAPLFWYALLGVPGMLAYKMVNTLDSMIGYRTERYALFGRTAARIDDAANYLPARITGVLIAVASGRTCRRALSFMRRFGAAHASPNSGRPEAAMAGVLDCRFGGTHDYFGKPVYKPYIGENERPFTMADCRRACRVCRRAEAMAVILALAFSTAVDALLR